GSRSGRTAARPSAARTARPSSSRGPARAATPRRAWRAVPKSRAPTGRTLRSGHSDREQQAVLLDGPARHGEEDHAIVRRADFLERAAEQVDELAKELTGLDRLAGPHAGKKDAFVR